jgi:hypothetical protein
VVPPSARDFQLEPRNRIVTQPRPTPQPEAEQQQPATPAPQQQQQQPQQQRPAQRTADPRPRTETPQPLPPAPRAPVPTAPVSGDSPREPAPAPATDAPTGAPLSPSSNLPPVTGTGLEPTPAPAAPAPAPAAIPADSEPADGFPLWMILLGGLALGLVGYTAFTRRRSVQRTALATPAATAAVAAPQAPRAPRPDPVPRPWLEVELTPERTTADPNESAVEFQLRIHNKGGSTASDIKLQAKLFCSTPEQDKQISAFHRLRPGDHKTLTVPDLPAGRDLIIKGRVDIKGDQIKVLQVDGRLLFVPLIAVNAFYGWGTARSGQTSKSFMVGREQDAAEKMAPFRMDLGPRVYRTVGQRPYAVERRV